MNYQHFSWAYARGFHPRYNPLSQLFLHQERAWVLTSILIRTGADPDFSTYSSYLLLDVQLRLAHCICLPCNWYSTHARTWPLPRLAISLPYRGRVHLFYRSLQLLPDAPGPDSNEGAMETKRVVHGEVRILLSACSEIVV